MPVKVSRVGLGGAFPADLAADNQHLGELYRDTGHYNPAGQRKLAAALERELARRYGIKP